MVRFKHDEKNLIDAFNLSKEEVAEVLSMVASIHKGDYKTFSSVTWAIQRFWIDETISDNAKCFMIFNLGRFYEFMKKGGDTENGRNYTD